MFDTTNQEVILHPGERIVGFTAKDFRGNRAQFTNFQFVLARVKKDGCAECMGVQDFVRCPCYDSENITN